jgi:hypothetical protein
MVIGSGAARETITNSYDGLDAVATFTEFLAEPPDMNVERPRIAVILMPPNAIEELLTRQDAIRTLCQY